MEKTLRRGSNVEAVKNAQNNKNGGGGFKYWKPRENGKYLIRFLPSGDVFYKPAIQHKIGDKYYFCPRTNNEECPICKKYHDLYKLKTTAAETLAKEIKPKEQYLYNVIVRQELDKPSDDPSKVFVYMGGKKIHGLLLNYFFDDEYGDFTDCDNGYDFVLVKEDDPTGSGFPYYLNSKPKKNPSKLFEDEDTIEQVLRNCKNLDDEVDILGYDELKKALDNFLANDWEDGELYLDSNIKAARSAKNNVASASSTSTATASSNVDSEADEFEKSLMQSLNSDD